MGSIMESNKDLSYSWGNNERGIEDCRREGSEDVLCLFVFYYFHCCSIIVVLISPIALPCPVYPPLPQSVPALLSMSMGHLDLFCNKVLPLVSPLIPFHAPLWSLSVSSLFPCLWFYFAVLFCFVLFC